MIIISVHSSIALECRSNTRGDDDDGGDDGDEEKEEEGEHGERERG